MSSGDRLVLAANLTWGIAVTVSLIMVEQWQWGAAWLMIGGAIVTVSLFVAAFNTLKED